VSFVIVILQIDDVETKIDIDFIFQFIKTKSSFDIFRVLLTSRADVSLMTSCCAMRHISDRE
jgi:hypothetical protein